MPSEVQTHTRKLAENRVGKLLDGKWMLESLLGFGGTAAVYAANHRNGKRAAIKILHPHCLADEQLRTRFVREGYVANKIGHPGAVSVLDDDVAADGTVYLVMELLEGMSLDRFHREGKSLTISEVVKIGEDLLDVLTKAHAVGVIHRDIKPANIFVTNAGQLKVLDFGIARIAQAPTDAAPTLTGLMMGTPAFMPPEQARARWDEVDARSDLWAVGATLFALLIGRRPRVADTANEELLLAMTEPLPPLVSLAPQVPLPIAAVIDKACAFQREDRWPSAAAMQQALHDSTIGSERTLAIAMPIPGPTPSGGLPVPPSNTVALPITPPPKVILAVPESDPSLTTSRAVLQSAPPMSTVRPPNNNKASILLVAFLALGLVGGLLLFLRARGLPNLHRTATATPAVAAAKTSEPGSATATASESAPPPPTDDPPPGPGSAQHARAVPAPPPTSPAATPSPSPNPGARPAAVPRSGGVRPAPSASADPNKYFDSRF